MMVIILDDLTPVSPLQQDPGQLSMFAAHKWHRQKESSQSYYESST